MKSQAGFAEYCAIRVAARTLESLPSAAATGLGQALAGAARTAGLRRAVAERQIATAFPDRRAAWVSSTARACYRHYGREAAEIARLYRFGTEGLSARLVLDEDTVGHVATMRDGRAAIIVGGHLGNWEVAGSYLASLGIPMVAVVKRQSNARVDAWIQAARRRVGCELIYQENAGSDLLRSLRAGMSIYIVADQHAGFRGSPVTFFGRPASVFRGPARLAVATGTPLVYSSLLRAETEYRLAIQPCDIPDGSMTESHADRERYLTEAWVRRLETRVREAPPQYLWFHRRWKRAGTQREKQT